MKRLQSSCALAIALALPGTAAASFHFMQIEQAIGGVQGDTSAQAIQLRMRAGGQNLVAAARLVARDATGANPVIVVDFGGNVANAAAGSRILVATVDFDAEPDVLPDFLMANPIPSSYLAAGRLTFESDGGIVYWSLCWGGAGYTGATTGNTSNDTDGDFGPCFAGPLPSATSQALQFTGAANAQSTNNAADYSLTVGAATVTNNAGASGLVSSDAVFADGFEGS